MHFSYYDILLETKNGSISLVVVIPLFQNSFSMIIIYLLYLRVDAKPLENIEVTLLCVIADYP